MTNESSITASAATKRAASALLLGSKVDGGTTMLDTSVIRLSA